MGFDYLHRTRGRCKDGRRGDGAPGPVGRVASRRAVMHVLHGILVEQAHGQPAAEPDRKLQCNGQADPLVQLPDAGRHASTLLRKLWRSEEHTSELQSLMRLPYAVFCSKNKITYNTQEHQELIQRAD